MKVLFIQVDVSNLSEEELMTLQDSIEHQVNKDYDHGDCYILATRVATVDEATGEIIETEEDIDEPIKH